MDEKAFFVLGIFLLLAVVSESRVLVPRSPQNDESSGNEEIPYPLDDSSIKDKNFYLRPGHSVSPDADYDFAKHEYEGEVNDPQTSDYDDSKPEESDNDTDNQIPLVKPEKVSSNADRGRSQPAGEADEDDKSVDGDFFEPFDKDDSVDEDKSIHKDIDESQNDDDSDQNEPEEGGNEEKDDVPEYGEGVGDEDAYGYFDPGFFESAFRTLEEMRRYFDQLERALQFVFRQTVNEARLLNGTYANTTEEEIDIKGKKYIVQKSVIKGPDNFSTIYVESLSSKPKWSDTEQKKAIEAKNVTKV